MFPVFITIGSDNTIVYDRLDDLSDATIIGAFEAAIEIFTRKSVDLNKATQLLMWSGSKDLEEEIQDNLLAIYAIYTKRLVCL